VFKTTTERLATQLKRTIEEETTHGQLKLVSKTTTQRLATNRASDDGDAGRRTSNIRRIGNTKERGLHDPRFHGWAFPRPLLGSGIFQTVLNWLSLLLLGKKNYKIYDEKKKDEEERDPPPAAIVGGQCRVLFLVVAFSYYFGNVSFSSERKYTPT